MADDEASATPRERAVDGRDDAAIRADARARAPFYTGDTWNPEADGPGTALLDLFAGLAGGVVDRLDQVPDKHRAAFVDALGFNRLAPQSARLPISVEISDGANGNVYLPAGTRALAPEAETRPELTFELEDGFEATPATMDPVLSVDPRLDHVAVHAEVLDPASTATLFGGANAQHRQLYLGHPDLLTLDAGALLQVRCASTADAATLAALDWEYYGEKPDEDPAEGWRAIEPVNVDAAESDDHIEIDDVAAILDDHGFELTTSDRDAVEHWLVATLLARAGADPTPPHVDPTREPAAADMYADLARYVDRVYGDYPPETSTVLSGVTLKFDVTQPFVETKQFETKSMWLRATLPADAAPPLAASLRAVDLQRVTLAAGRLQPPTDDGIFSRHGAGASGEELRRKYYSERERRVYWKYHGDGDITDARSVKPGTFTPDDLLANDVPLKVPTPENNAEVRPFGALPRVQDAFYINSKEAFTKSDQQVTVSFNQTAPVDVGAQPPHVSWEYWNGSAWEYLGVGVKDGDDGDETTALAKTGEFELKFDVPDDLQPTGVSGHDGHWIRARLVGGGFGKIKIEDGEDVPDGSDDTPLDEPIWPLPDEDVPDGSDDTPPDEQIWQRLDEVTPPLLDKIRLRYQPPSETGDDGAGDGESEDGDGPPPGGPASVPPELIQKAPEQCYRVTNLAVTAVDPDSRFQPFAPLPDDEQAVYLGFDGPLEGGPLQVFVELADFAYPARFHPRVRWEVSTDDGWQRVSVRDGTDGLTERGVVRFTPPTATSPLDRFGESRHWLRARVTAPGGFVNSPYRRKLAPGETPPDERCGDHLATTPPGGESAMALPESALIVPNTGWASNVRTIDDEILGSSNGRPDQEFQVLSPPARDVAVRVDELATLSAGERDRLEADSEVPVEVEGDPGDPDAFWVAWQPVENFLTSGPDDRHYTIDAVDGTVTFGDGTTGAIPPRGRDNLRVDYETGGGTAGNVPAGAVDELEGSLAFVDNVANRLSSDGGGDAEPTAAVLERAPEELRDRNRAVARVDYERLAKASARKVARAHCLPSLGPRGTYKPGYVTVLIVPQTAERVPMPSASLKTQVTDSLHAAAPAPVLGDLGDERLVVRAPTFVEVTVEATIEADAPDSLAALEAAAADALEAYFHPLTGGDNADGWPFGELPCVSDCYRVLEGVPDVDHVSDIALHFAATGVTRTIRPGEEPPGVEPDVLVHSGVHDLDVRGGV